MTKPAYSVNAKGVITIDYLLFQRMDPYAVCAAVRSNLRVAQTKTENKRQRQQETVKVLVNVGQH